MGVTGTYSVSTSLVAGGFSWKPGLRAGQPLVGGVWLGSARLRANPWLSIVGTGLVLLVVQECL